MGSPDQGSQDYWRGYWRTPTDGGHRSQDEAFLAREAREKLFHLETPRQRLLDFGCGSGDLLAYYAEGFEQVVGADFSESMLGAARERLRAQGVPTERVQLLMADDQTIWEQLAGTPPFDAITTAAVAQYMPAPRIEAFCARALSHLTPAGMVAFFDVIDPRFYALAELGLLPRSPGMLWPARRTPATQLVRGALGVARARMLRAAAGLPPREIGLAHHPALFEDLAHGHDASATFVGSMYYEYRYHVLLRPGGGR